MIPHKDNVTVSETADYDPSEEWGHEHGVEVTIEMTFRRGEEDAALDYLDEIRSSVIAQIKGDAP